LKRTAGRFVFSILTLVAGVAFFRPALALQQSDPLTDHPVHSSISSTDATGETAFHRAAGLTTFPLLEQSTLARRPASKRTDGTAAPVSTGGWDGNASNVAKASGGRGPSTSPAALAQAVSARDAVARAGRLSAPTTAPPTSPF
jgi:hypothetical protein